MSEKETAGEIGRAAASGFEQWARDTLCTFAAFISVFAALMSVTGDGRPLWLAVGAVVGLAGIVLPFVARFRWSGPTSWLVGLSCLIASSAVIFAVGPGS